MNDLGPLQGVCNPEISIGQGETGGEQQAYRARGVIVASNSARHNSMRTNPGRSRRPDCVKCGHCETVPVFNSCLALGFREP